MLGVKLGSALALRGTVTTLDGRGMDGERLRREGALQRKSTGRGRSRGRDLSSICLLGQREHGGKELGRVVAGEGVLSRLPRCRRAWGRNLSLRSSGTGYSRWHADGEAGQHVDVDKRRMDGKGHAHDQNY
jgi:hypothetical protein